jgi:ubiquinone/menaquinone biosynthesis C-methylase UbiE
LTRKTSQPAHITDRNAVRDVIADSGLRSVLARIFGQGRKLLGGDRFATLSVFLAETVSSLKAEVNGDIKLLDFGCGNMAISQYLAETSVVASMLGVDTYPRPPLEEQKFRLYEQIQDAKHLPFSDNSFDVAICVDVLHHVGLDESAGVLRELARVSKLIVVKDHFEFGYISRQLLRLADWYGNYAYGVNVPDRYYDQGLWRETLQAAGLTEISLKTPLRIHSGLFGFVLRPRSHFISVLTVA